MTAPATGTVSRDLTFPQPPAAVWRALTDSAALADWLMPNDLRPEVGHSFEFRSQAYGDWDGVIHCEVLECVPTSRLVYSWASLGVETTVTFELIQDGDGTRLHFQQTGFDLSQPFGNQALAGAEHGWNGFFAKLPAVIEAL